MQTLNEKIQQMQKEIRKFEDIDVVKSEGTERNRKLQKELVSLEQRAKKFVDALRAISQEHAKMKVIKFSVNSKCCVFVRIFWTQSSMCGIYHENLS